MLTIAWDVDDVLNELMRTWFTEIWRAEHPECAVSYSQISENPPDQVLGISRGEYLCSLDAFRASERAREMDPNPVVLQWLKQSGANYRHIALTARPLESAPHAAEWVFRHFGTYMRTFAVVPTRFAEGVPIYDHDKAEYLSWLRKADVLVDDSKENIRRAERLGLRGILYPQPWNEAHCAVEQTLQSLAQLAEVR